MAVTSTAFNQGYITGGVKKAGQEDVNEKNISVGTSQQRVYTKEVGMGLVQIYFLVGLMSSISCLPATAFQPHPALFPY